MIGQGANSTRHARLLIALFASLALHGVMLAVLRTFPASRIFPDTQALRPSLAVFLAPLSRRAEPARPTGATRDRPQAAAAPALVASSRADSPPTSGLTNAEQSQAVTVLPHFDPEGLRRQAREQDRMLRRESLTAPAGLAKALRTPAPERETVFSVAIAKARRPDCRTAYSGGGLFAIPMLLYDAATDKGCQW